jgi:hypothetical protein
MGIKETILVSLIIQIYIFVLGTWGLSVLYSGHFPFLTLDYITHPSK